MTAGLFAFAVSAAAAQQDEQRAPQQFSATMTGSNEVPGPGDSDGSGMAMVTVDRAKSQVCYEITTSNLSQATAAHIHRGEAGVAGPPVVTLKTPTSGQSKDCAQVDEDVAEDIVEHPGEFYVNVHTADHTSGAIRGQLQAAGGMMHDMGGMKQHPTDTMRHDTTTMPHDTIMRHDTTSTGGRTP
ncbi:MAG TPA: CHRD domain-containing protein [Gemmatimonadaceae bacterium]|nr:CHRD domain-containing protein [Gemmatimonadaceae bacterium]